MVLKQKLQQKNITFEICDNLDEILNKGFLTVPVLEIDGEQIDFTDAIKWVNAQKGE